MHKLHSYIEIAFKRSMTCIRKNGNDIKSDMESFEHLQRWMQGCINQKGINVMKMHFTGF